MSKSQPVRRRVALLLLVALCVPAFSHFRRASAGSLVPPAVPAQGAYFGSHVGTLPGETRFDAIARRESQIGRRFDVDHEFYRWDAILPTSTEVADVAAGRIPFMSWKPQLSGSGTSTIVSWPSIANGSRDAVIVAQADRVRNFGHPVFMTFNHEPYNESTSGWGSPADFVAAFQHVVNVFRAEGAANVAWVLVLTGYDYTVGRADSFYPGDAYVDWIAADPYNFFTKDGYWADLSQKAAAFYAWASPKGKPLMLAEWGSEEDPATPGRKAQWFNNAKVWLETRPAIKAVEYFDDLTSDGFDWRVDTSTSSLAAYTAMGADAWFNPLSLVTTTTATVPSTTTTLPVTTTTLPSTTTTTTAPPPPVSVMFAPQADAQVVKGSPGRNYGSSTHLGSDRSPVIESYLRFNVSGLTAPVAKVRLRLYVTNGSVNGPKVYPTGTSWPESGVTWNNRPARTGPVVADAGAITAGHYVEWDVTAAVTGNGAYSFDLAADSTDGSTFNSREATSGRPQLVVTLA